MSRPMNVRVAIVDDSEIARVAVSRALTGASGITLLGAFESVAALEQSRLMPRAHVILLDVWMPERSGLSAIRELASRARVVVLSDTKEDSSIAKEARAQGASGFFTKASLASDAGREALFDPNWPLHAAAALGVDPEFALWPQQYGWWLTRRESLLKKLGVR